MRCIRWFLLSWFVFVLSGCASVFDAPYEEIETEGPEAVSDPHPLVEVTPSDLHEMIGLPETGKVHYQDIWDRIRQGFRVPDLDKDPQVIRGARRFAADKFLDHTAQRAGNLLFYVVEEVDARKLPMELVLVPFVESGYTLEAKSQAEAHGAWQFIENTARTYELNIDRFRDERRSLVASTRAAMDYLSMLNGMFDSWPLAMAAYNCGEKRVLAEVNRAKARGIKKPGFNDIAASLPQETRDYVPRILALKSLIANPAAYKASLPPIENASRHTVIEMHRDIDVSLVAQLAGLKLNEFLALNPSLQAPIIIGNNHTQLLLPHAAALQLALRMGVHKGSWVSWRLIRITRPTSPGELARRNNVPAKLIAQVNPLPEGHYYAVGATLLIPLKGDQVAEEIPQQLARGAILLTKGVGLTSKAASTLQPPRN
ncbi:transglycosylase SLT domain-containing protein [Quatrionicoccus australiensis]|uniref:transglycosylase SLT domain-containing protein n=1 Tax=Quatrionicoccus australiensis TaxID=138118 RepID=UPI001CF8CF46|nr:transglycosylase SLT domain-containing protein [Quatrionicoccus australiensis]UCV13951.1 transglycosylase SLT domain-containing protein [Quatrionicoccus australiensis]